MLSWDTQRGPPRAWERWHTQDPSLFRWEIPRKFSYDHFGDYLEAQVSELWLPWIPNPKGFQSPQKRPRLPSLHPADRVPFLRGEVLYSASRRSTEKPIVPVGMLAAGPRGRFLAYIYLLAVLLTVWKRGNRTKDKRKRGSRRRRKRRDGNKVRYKTNEKVRLLFKAFVMN